MRTSTVSKVFSIFISFVLVGSSIPTSAGAVESAAALPDFVKTLTPPETLGYVDSFYKGNTEHPVILVQDLHANYGVQKKIEGLLQSMQPKIAQSRPMVIGVEGAWGDVSVASVRDQAPKVRQAAADFLLKNVEISGMEHFAVLSEKDVHLVGIDNPDDYIVHSQLFRKSLAARLALAQKADKLRYAINGSKGEAPRALQRLWKNEESFHAGQMSLAELSGKLGVPLSDYKQAEEVLSNQKRALAEKEQGQTGFLVKNITEADQNLNVLARLLRQQLTLEEVQFAAKRVPAIMLTVRALLPNENLNLWNDTVRSAIDHYAVAILRDKPLSEHAIDLAQKYSDSSVVIVTGGFHTQGITNALKAKKISYVSLAPVVESHTARDEALYALRMMDIHVTPEQIATLPRLGPSVQTNAVSTSNFNERTTNPQSMVSRFPNAANVIPEVIDQIKNGKVPTVSAEQAAEANAVQALVTPSVDLNATGLLSRIGNALRRLTGRPEQISLPNVPAETESAKVTLNTLQPKTSGEHGFITIGAVSAVLGAVALAPLAQHAVQHAVNTGDSSSALVAAGAGLIGVGMAWYNKKKMAEQLKKARTLAMYGFNA